LSGGNLEFDLRYFFFCCHLGKFLVES
jgi:hypothetical protein